MAKAKSVKANVDLDPNTKLPTRFFDVQEKISQGSAKDKAEEFLKKAAGDLRIRPDLSQLKFDQMKDSILGKHVLFQQYEAGKPITGAWARVDINDEGAVYNVETSLVPDRDLAKIAKIAAAAPTLTKDAAVQKAIEATGPVDRGYRVEDTEEVMYPVGGVPRPAWKVVIVREQPRGDWKVYVDAVNSDILGKINLLKAQNGKGRVFDPNPVVSLNDTSLRDTSTIPDAAYHDVELRDLDGSGHLDGPFVTTKTTSNRVKRSNLDFRFKRADRAFKEVMVYFHIDRLQRYLQELGFDNVLNKPIAANIDGETDDNSNYSPVTKSLTFGTGGVDDAEDAEIVLHEYGHAVQDAQVNGFGATPEGKAMGEGFGDYLAASYFFDRKPAIMRPTVGNWDATSYSGSDPPFLRRLDSNKLYPRDIVGEEHADGEIWSACLWQIRAAVGGRTSDRLVITHHFLLSPRSKFEDAAKALITADSQLNGGRNEKAIRDVFVARGILPNPDRSNKRAGIPFAAIPSHRDRPTPVRGPTRSATTGRVRKSRSNV
jgi:hypothetical protein